MLYCNIKSFTITCHQKGAGNHKAHKGDIGGSFMTIAFVGEENGRKEFVVSSGKPEPTKRVKTPLVRFHYGGVNRNRNKRK